MKTKKKHIAWWDELPEEHKFERLPTSRKRLSDTMKMIAYRAEAAMVNIIRNSTPGTTDVRAILRDLFNNEADIFPDDTNKTLTITVHGAANPATNKITINLLDELNHTETLCSGTDLRLCYKCAIPGPWRKPTKGDTKTSPR